MTAPTEAPINAPSSPRAKLGFRPGWVCAPGTAGWATLVIGRESGAGAVDNGLMGGGADGEGAPAEGMLMRSLAGSGASGGGVCGDDAGGAGI